MFHGNNKISNIFHLNDVIQKIMYKDEIVYTSYYTYTLSGVPPLKFWSVGKPLLEYEIDGKTYQATTPSPESPVEVKGVGVKTGNLLDDSQFKDATVNLKYFPLFVGNGEFTLSCDIPPYGSDKLSDVFLLSDNVTSGDPSTTNGANSTKSITTASRNGYITIAYRNSYFTKLSEHNIMLNEGSTALPYEPFGYKIGILCEGKNAWKNDWSQFDNSGGEGDTYAYFKLPRDDTRYTLTLTAKKDFVANNDTYIGFTRFGGKSLSSNDYIWLINRATRLNKGDMIKKSGGGSASSMKFISIYTATERWFNELIETFDIQLELGDTATPYEPYKTPITTNIYTDKPLYSGEVLRSDGSRDVKWKELVLTGDEAWGRWGTKTYGISIIVNDLYNDRVANIRAYSTHFAASYTSWSSKGKSEIMCNNRAVILTFSDDINVEDAVAFLKSEYEKGTPVTVWYKVSEPTTEQIALPEIPTLAGNNVLSVQTEVQPENVTIKYRTDKKEN